jgi:hypothetical protein
LYRKKSWYQFTCKRGHIWYSDTILQCSMHTTNHQSTDMLLFWIATRGVILSLLWAKITRSGKGLISRVNDCWLPLKKYSDLGWNEINRLLVAVTLCLLFVEIYNRGLYPLVHGQAFCIINWQCKGLMISTIRERTAAQWIWTYWHVWYMQNWTLYLIQIIQFRRLNYKSNIMNLFCVISFVFLLSLRSSISWLLTTRRTMTV